MTATKTCTQPIAQLAAEPETMRELYGEHAAFVWRIARRLGVRSGDVEDVCQQVFLVVHRRLGDLDHRPSRNWIYGVVRRVASDYRRSAYIRREILSDETFDAPREPEQVRSFERKQARVLLEELLDTLDEGKREVFVLSQLEGIPMKEVAAMVGCPVATAHSRLRLAREQLERAAGRHERGGGKT